VTCFIMLFTLVAKPLHCFVYNLIITPKEYIFNIIVLYYSY
jgi:hypothetical protein